MDRTVELEEIVFSLLCYWIRVRQFTFLLLFPSTSIYKRGIMVIPFSSISVSTDEIETSNILSYSSTHDQGMVDTRIIFASEVIKH